MTKRHTIVLLFVATYAALGTGAWAQPSPQGFVCSDWLVLKGGPDESWQELDYWGDGLVQGLISGVAESEVFYAVAYVVSARREGIDISATAAEATQVKEGLAQLTIPKIRVELERVCRERPATPIVYGVTFAALAIIGDEYVSQTFVPMLEEQMKEDELDDEDP